MPRPHYPSDLERIKLKPHIKVFLTIINHPKYGAVVDDPKTRGVLVGLWMLAGRAHANKTGDWLSLSGPDLCWISGTSHRGYAEKCVRTVAELMNYRLRTNGERLEILIRNWSKKQHFTPRFRGGETESTPPRGGARNKYTRKRNKEETYQELPVVSDPPAERLLEDKPENGEPGTVEPIVATWNRIATRLRLEPVSPERFTYGERTAVIALLQAGIQPATVCHAIEQIEYQPWLVRPGPGDKPITFYWLVSKPDHVALVGRRYYAPAESGS